MKQRQLEAEEQQQTSRDDEEAAAEWVELEYELGEMKRESSTESKSLLDRLVSKLVRTTTGTVVDITRKENTEQVTLHVDIDGRTQDFSFKWPSSADEYSDDLRLIRLLKYVGVRPERLADLHGEAVPVVQKGTRHKVAVPASPTRSANLMLRLCMGLFSLHLIDYQQTTRGQKMHPTFLGFFTFSLTAALIGTGMQLFGAATGFVFFTVIGSIMGVLGMFFGAISFMLMMLLGIAIAGSKAAEHIWPF